MLVEDHQEYAEKLLDEVGEPDWLDWSLADRIALARVHTMLALVERLKSLKEGLE